MAHFRRLRQVNKPKRGAWKAAVPGTDGWRSTAIALNDPVEVVRRRCYVPRRAGAALGPSTADSLWGLGQVARLLRVAVVVVAVIVVALIIIIIVIVFLVGLCSKPELGGDRLIGSI